MANSFGSRTRLPIDGQDYSIYSLATVARTFPEVLHLPFALRILLENLLRTEDGRVVQAEDIAALARWQPRAAPSREIAFTPSRVLLQDFTGVPAIVDLAAMREAVQRLGGDPKKINPLQKVELVIDHSVQVDAYGTPQALRANSELEYQRNRERYIFLRWGQKAFANFRVVPPETGIVHQVNLEYLARVTFTDDSVQPTLLYPDTLVGTDSHTTMINGLGVLGWGVGGIEAEAAMLGQPVSMLIPQVVGFRLYGQLPEGATATDLVLTVTEMLRRKGVVGKFVEFYGEGLAALPLADRATIANMAPEYGATCGIFPIDVETLRYLRLTGRSEEHVRKVEAYTKAQGMFHGAGTMEAAYSDTLELDLGKVEPSLAGPTRPQDRVPLSQAGKSFRDALQTMLTRTAPRVTPGDIKRLETEGASPAAMQVPEPPSPPLPRKILVQTEDAAHELDHGAVVIAAITSCTNTSNPSVMLAAGLLAKKAVERGLQSKAWVKTSLAPGSKAVTEYLEKAGLMRYLQQLRFNLVGYGCTTCVAEGTPVLLANGTARRIEQMPSAGGAVLFSPTEDGKLVLAMQTEAFAQGVRDCVTLVLQDGRTLTCTPDHEILCADGRWVRADELELDENRVVVGLEAPLDEPGEDETAYLLPVGGLKFTMDTAQERLRTLAFARLLGHLLGDGSISAAGQGRVNVGQAVDREVVLNDIEVVTGKRPAASRYDERKWSIVLPAPLTAAIATLPGVRLGRRIDQPPTLPAFVLDEQCPVAVVREFLGGAFGADGQAPALHRMNERAESAILSHPAYSQTARPEHASHLKDLLRQLLRLLDRCGVKTDGANVYEYPTRRSASTYPAARDGTPRVEVRLKLPDGLSFVERVGFRYCVDKALRASAAAVYWRTVSKIAQQRLWMSSQLDELHRLRPELKFRQARELAAAEMSRRATVVFPHYSLLKGHDRFDRLPRPEARTFQPLHRDSCGFPSPVELFEQLGVRDWFAVLQARAETDYAKRYCVEKTATTLPTLSLRVLDRRPAGECPVFDLSVSEVHSFVASTVAASNCIGNSGPLPPPVSKAIEENDLVVAAVLSGNRNFEGRIHAEVRANYLASPPLVVAYALAGRMDIDLTHEPLGQDTQGRPVFLRDIWPTQQEVREAIDANVQPEVFGKVYSNDRAFQGDERWNSLPAPEESLYQWQEDSTYVKHPPYFEGMTHEPEAVGDLKGMRVLAVLGDSITTDHISPAGTIKEKSPAGQYLIAHGVAPADFNSYGSRRGNHEVMMRGTFANVRLKNRLAPDTVGGVTRHLPDGAPMSIFDAAMKYKEEGIPLLILAGKEYGSGSSRDWAAKGPRLLGVRTVIAESYERIHRSNLVGMGVLPLQFGAGDSATSLGLTGEEVYDLEGLPAALEALAKGETAGRDLAVKARRPDGVERTFQATVRIDTPQEVLYYRHGGILHYVLRQLVKQKDSLARKRLT